MSDIEVALEALQSDAAAWDSAAGDLGEAGAVVSPLGLTPADVMSYAAAQGFDRQYGEILGKLEDSLRQGALNFHRISDSLRRAAEMYRLSEEQHKEKLRKADGH
jgi:hypothetical protein